MATPTMFERLTGRGFQRHEHITVELDPLCTTIVGASDKGKSTLVRLLKWIATNQPPKGDIINWNCEEAVGTLVFDGGRKVTRRQGKRVNSYRLDKEPPLVSFGRGKVPQDIADLLNVGEVNFAEQHALPHWLSDTAGQVSKRLNSVVNLAEIDAALANAASGVKKAVATLEVTKTRLKEARERRDSLAWVDKLNERLLEAERLAAGVTEKRSRASQIEELVRQGREAQAEIDRSSCAILALQKAVSLGQEYLTVKQKADTLESLVGEGRRLERLASAPLPDVGPLQEMVNKITALRARADAIEELVREGRRLEDLACQAENDSSSARERLRKLTRGRCPTCMQRITTSSPSAAVTST